MTALLAALVLFLASCSNGINGTDASGNSADGKTYISISAKTASSRSIAPGADDYSTEKLTNLVLSGKTVGEGAESDTEAVPLAQAESLAELSEKSIPIEAGNWLLTLSASLNGVTFYGETRAEIEKGKINPISFTLTSATSYGGMSITVEFTGEADKVSVSLKKAGNEELLADSELSPVQGTDGKKSVTFSRSATNEEEKLESGSYYLLFEFFGLEGVERLNTVENIVRIKEGITTTATLTLNLNEIYTISYQTNGGEIASTDDILTNKYSRKSETISLPQMKKTGCIFKGWYKSSDINYENPLESIDSSRASDLTLVAYFEEILSNLYVTARTLAAGESDTGNGSQEKPFANIQNAIEKIKSYNAADVDYTITVSGMDDSTEKVSGNKAGLLIADISAASILIQGDGTGVADGIQSAAYQEVPVVINTPVPITFKNFVIKPYGYVQNSGDGYVLVLKNGSNVTLSQGFEVDGSGDTDTSITSHDSFGAVYVSDGASLVMEENASVHDVRMSGKDNNTNDFGAGIFVAGNLEMGGTSSVYGTNSTANKGGGIYIASTGKVTLKDSAIIGSTDSSKGNSCTYNGGGLYVAGGELIMTGGTIASNKQGATTVRGRGVYLESGSFKIGGNALVSSNNDVYLASGTKVTIAGPLTGTSPVATITPGEYTAETRLLEVSSDSGTTLAAEYEKFAVTKDAKVWYLSEEGNLASYGQKAASQGYEVGDIVFNDGSATPYTADLTLTDKQKSAAIAVIFYTGTELNNDSDTTTVRTLGLGLNNSTGTGNWFAWTIEGSEGYNNYLPNLQCDVDNKRSSTESTFGDVLDGSNLWSTLCGYVDDEETSGNYPAWEWVNNYATSNSLTGDYASGWYLPTAAELAKLYCAIYPDDSVINAALNAAGGREIARKNGTSGVYYWSASQTNPTANYAFSVSMNNGFIQGEGKGHTQSVCAIRAF